MCNGCCQLCVVDQGTTAVMVSDNNAQLVDTEQRLG